MFKKNRDLRANARGALRGNWGMVITLFIVLLIIIAAAEIVGAFIPILGYIGVGMIMAAINLGVIIFTLNLLKNKCEFKDAFKGFNSIWKAFCATFMVALFTTLWSLILIIPGVIKMYSYSQTLYRIAENPNIPVMEAITESRKMMNGLKFKLFFLQLSFIGWGILSILTFGLGFIWLVPYIRVSKTAFYIDAKKNINKCMN